VPNLNVSLPIQLAQAPTASSHYRPDIDGLRAIAIIAVVAYHGFPTWIHGGFVGVDIFFVISGYLITGVIFGHVLADDFSILDFYQRRIRRIFPALLLVTFVVFLLGWFVLAPREFESLGTNIAGGALFVQNFVLLGQVGYFDIEAAKKPLLHLWSLGIEEQYYIAWPLLLLLFRRQRWDAAGLTIALTIISFCLGLLVFQKSPDFAFYLPFTRAWELLVGSTISIFLLATKHSVWIHWADSRFRILAAYAEGHLQKLAQRLGAPPREDLLRETFAVIALAAVTFAVLRYKPHTPYPGSAAVISVAGTAVLILTAGAAVNRFFLSSRPMVFIGLISYPLYLWHFPLMAYARIASEDAVPYSTMTAIVAVSFVLAWLTYQFVERPIRFGKRFRRVKITALVAGMASVGALGLIVIALRGVPSRVPEDLRKFVATSAPTSSDWRVGRCMLLPEQKAEDFSGCDGEGPRPRLFLWGDSFAAALYPGLQHYSHSSGYSISQYASSACPPLSGYRSVTRPYCKSINDYVLTRIAEEQPDIVILHCKWLQYDENGDLQKGLDETIPKLKALNVKSIVLIGPMPTWYGNGLPENVLDYYYHNGLSLLPERTKYRSMDVVTGVLNERFRAQAEKLGIKFISARDVMCNDDGCLARIGENGSDLTAFDVGHMTIAGSIFMAQAIRDQLLEMPETSNKQ
jgi:peptidoglycan/LPS O-acetylase OafA/YrhL